MKVNELMMKLSTLPPDTQVVAEDDYAWSITDAKYDPDLDRVVLT